MTISTRKHNAAHITIFAVYRTFTMYGQLGRYFKIAFPNRADADAYVHEHLAKGFYKESDFIVEEMPAIMKAWKG